MRLVPIFDAWFIAGNFQLVPAHYRYEDPMWRACKQPPASPFILASSDGLFFQQSSPVTQPLARRSSQHSRANAGHESPPVEEVPVRERPRSKSTSHQRPPVGFGEDLPPVPSHRTRAKSTHGSSSRNTSTPVVPDLPKAIPRRQAVSSPSRRPLNSSLRKVLPENFKFRILVVGKSRSGKSSLIKTVFKVNMAAASENADISVEFRPADNRYLIVHECSDLDSQTTRDFISRRTDAGRLPPERLHAIWICVPASDAIAGRFGDGVKEILALRNVPVILVFTKFDMVVSQVLLDRFSGAPQYHEGARASAHSMYEGSCRHIFDKEPRDVPAEIVSEKGKFSDLIDNLVVTTDRLITGSRGSTRAGAQAGKQRLGAVPLSWSAAVRMNHDVIIQTTIEVGRSRYWRSLWSSLDFADQSLKNCVNIIHDDIVEIWNLNDKTGYLLNDKFKARMSHLVKDLAVSANAPSTAATHDYPDWAHDTFKGSPENVRCVVGYIVDLTVIMDGIFRVAAGDMAPKHALQVLDRHEKSGRKDLIHRDIRSFIAEAFAIRFSVPGKDLVLERIIDLIKQHCVPTSTSP
ncbi:hypothetical protein V8E53_005497 [Lactarius tabidus]